MFSYVFLIIIFYLKDMFVVINVLSSSEILGDRMLHSTLPSREGRHSLGEIGGEGGPFP